MTARAMHRRRFVRVSGGGLFGGIVVAVSAGCDDARPTTPAGDGVVGDVSLNHGHVAVIGATRLRAGEALRLDITGASTHSHYVDLAAADLARIRAGERLSFHSTDGFDDKHDHVVTFNAGAGGV